MPTCKKNKTIVLQQKLYDKVAKGLCEQDSRYSDVPLHIYWYHTRDTRSALGLLIPKTKYKKEFETVAVFSEHNVKIAEKILRAIGLTKITFDVKKLLAQIQIMTSQAEAIFPLEKQRAAFLCRSYYHLLELGKQFRLDTKIIEKIIAENHLQYYQ